MDYRPPKLIDGRLPEILCNLADRALAIRNEPDQGIWKLHTEPQHMFHTQALLWVALGRGVGIERIEKERLVVWENAAADLRSDDLDHGWNVRRGAYTQAYGSDVLDAAVLRTVLFGAISLDDPRLQSTLDVVQRELAVGDLLYRYKTPDDLTGTEGTFTVRAFWLVGCLGLTGRTEAAHLLYRCMLLRANDAGLFVEEIDAVSNEQRGNFPKASPT